MVLRELLDTSTEKLESKPLCTQPVQMKADNYAISNI